MKWYGSIENRIEERAKGLDPQVGMGVTEYMWSDRHAYEIVEVKDSKNFKMRRYEVKNIGSGFGDNSWELISNPEGYVYEMTFRYGAWYHKQTYTKEMIEKRLQEDGYILLDPKVVETAMKKGVAYTYDKKNIVIGHADYYYDYEF